MAGKLCPKPSHELQPIIEFDNKEEAEETIVNIIKFIRSHGHITVPEFYDLCGLSDVSTSGLEKLGWKETTDFVLDYHGTILIVYKGAELIDKKPPFTRVSYRAYRDELESKKQTNEELALTKIREAIELLIRSGYSYEDESVKTLRNVYEDNSYLL